MIALCGLGSCSTALIRSSPTIGAAECSCSKTFCTVNRAAACKRKTLLALSCQLRPCESHDLFEDLVPYVGAWRWQKETVERMAAAVSRGDEAYDSLILLQHPPVYTMGTHSSDNYLRFDKKHPPFELHRTERGGEVTYHGPGQLVMYPILNLRNHKMDLHWYLRMLEEVVIRALWSACGLKASRIDGMTGVWIGEQKVAAIGVRVSRWITYHGLSLNVTTDLSPFGNIVPCGISDRSVGSIRQLLEIEENDLEHNVGLVKGQESPLAEISSKILDAAIQQRDLQDALLLRHVHDTLLEEFAAVFEVQLVPPTRQGPQTLKQTFAELQIC